jgi:hypothetical protein
MVASVTLPTQVRLDLAYSVFDTAETRSRSLSMVSGEAIMYCSFTFRTSMKYLSKQMQPPLVW